MSFRDPLLLAHPRHDRVNRTHDHHSSSHLILRQLTRPLYVPPQLESHSDRHANFTPSGYIRDLFPKDRDQQTLNHGCVTYVILKCPVEERPEMAK